MPVSSVSGPPWYHEPQSRRVHHTRLEKEVVQLSQELRCTKSQSHSRSGCCTIPERDFIVPRPIVQKSTEQADLTLVGAHLGVRKDVVSEVPCCRPASDGPGPQNPSCSQPTIRAPMTGNRSGKLTRGPVFQTRDGQYTNVRHVNTLPSQHSLRYGQDDSSKQPSRIPSCEANDQIWLNTLPAVESAVGYTLEQRSLCAFPDLFFAQNPWKYSAYKFECLRFYGGNFKEFMRRGLEKHLMHYAAEGISKEDFERAMKVPGPRGKLSKEKMMKWYLDVRRDFFQVPVDQPIMECDQPGLHGLYKCKRSRSKQPAVSGTGTKRSKACTPDTLSLSDAVSASAPAINPYAHHIPGSTFADGHYYPFGSSAITHETRHGYDWSIPGHFDGNSGTQPDRVVDAQLKQQIDAIYANLKQTLAKQRSMPELGRLDFQYLLQNIDQSLFTLNSKWMLSAGVNNGTHSPDQHFIAPRGAVNQRSSDVRPAQSSQVSSEGHTVSTKPIWTPRGSSGAYTMESNPYNC